MEAITNRKTQMNDFESCDVSHVGIVIRRCSHAKLVLRDYQQVIFSLSLQIPHCPYK